MSRFSPFPDGADRPWRGVWVYASHAIEERLRSWAFWLGLFGLPLLYAVAFLAVDQDEVDLGPMVVVAEPAVGDALEAAARRRGIPVERADAVPEDPGGPVLVVAGDGLDAMEPVLVVASGPAESLARWSARSILREARLDAYLDPSERELIEASAAPEDLADVTADRLGTLLPLTLVALCVLFGAMSGFGAAQQLSRVRGKEYFAVLRMGTPIPVIFLGGLAEHALMGALTVVPLALLLIPLLGLALLGMSVVLDSGRLLLWVPLLALGGAVASFFVVSAVGSVLGSLERGSRSIRGGTGFLFLLIYPALIPLFPVLMERTVDHPSVWLFVPVLGTLEAAIGVGGELGGAWLALVALLQLPWILLGIRVGSWAYALDEGPLEDVGRRWRRWRAP